MKQLSLGIIFILSSFLLIAQASIADIPGWKREEQGGNFRFVPLTGAVGKTFLYDLQPLRKGNGESGSSWFKGLVASDVERTGYVLPANDNTQVNIQSGVYSYTTQVSDRQGKKWLMSYMGYQLNGEYRLARLVSSPDVTYFKDNIKPAINHFGRLAKADGLVFKSGSASRNDGSASGKTTTTTRVKPEELLTENGLKPAAIKGIAIHLEYIAGVGGAIYPSYEPYLLLTDGSIYDGPSVSPYHFDVAKSKQLEPRKWGTWKAVGKTIEISWPAKERPQDKSDTWEKDWFWARPATNGEKIDGSYKTISGGGNTALGGNIIVMSASNITFNKEGQFTFARTSGGSNNGDFGVASSTYAHKDGAGTYVLNGFSLELRFNNGQVKKQAFYFYPDSKETMGIGTSAYVPAGEKK